MNKYFFLFLILIFDVMILPVKSLSCDLSLRGMEIDASSIKRGKLSIYLESFFTFDDILKLENEVKSCQTQIALKIIDNQNKISDLIHERYSSNVKASDKSILNLNDKIKKILRESFYLKEKELVAIKISIKEKKDPLKEILPIVNHLSENFKIYFRNWEYLSTLGIIESKLSDTPDSEYISCRKLKSVYFYPYLQNDNLNIFLVADFILEKENHGMAETDIKEISSLNDSKFRISGPFNMEFIYIPPGSFMMGSPPDEPGKNNDEILHQVTITKGFYMQTTELTQGQWESIMGENPSNFKFCGNDCPAERISWEDTQMLIQKLNQYEGSNKFRLPTEAEWEYACRAGTNTALYTGQITIKGENNAPQLNEISWYAGNSGVDYNGGWDCTSWQEKQFGYTNCGIHRTGQKKPNPWGLFDMIGNVWEWCQDWYGPYELTESITDPQGPKNGTERIIRGGGWGSYARYCRSAFRFHLPPANRYPNSCFRLVRSQ